MLQQWAGKMILNEQSQITWFIPDSKGGKSMTWNQLYNFRQILEELLIESFSSQRDTARKLKRSIWNCADENDRGSLESERALLVAQAEWTDRLIKEIMEALKLIDNGDFGVCASCEEDINPRRLLVYPTARYCAQCQEIKDSDKRSKPHSVPGWALQG